MSGWKRTALTALESYYIQHLDSGPATPRELEPIGQLDRVDYPSQACSCTNQELIPAFGAVVVLARSAPASAKALPIGIWWMRGIRGACQEIWLNCRAGNSVSLYFY